MGDARVIDPQAPRSPCAPAAAGALLAALALLAPTPPAQADDPAPVAVAVSGSGCPERAPLVDALRARGLAVVEGAAPFRLDVAVGGDALHLVLRDADRATVLERTIASGECVALAETVAMLVERRLAGVEWQAPLGPNAPRPHEPATTPAPPPRPHAHRASAPRTPPSSPWAVDLFAGVAHATSFREGAGGTGPSFDLRLRPPSPFGVRLGVEWLQQPDLPISTGAFEVQRVPIALAGGWSLRRPGLEADLEAAVLLEIISARSRDIAVPASSTQLAIRAGPAAAVGLQLVPHLWLLAHGGAYAVVSGYDFVVHSVSEPSRKTRVASQVAGLEVGGALGWRFGP